MVGGTTITETKPEEGKEEIEKDLLEVNFLDIQSHRNKKDIIYLAERGIVEGKTRDSFDPDGRLTRAQFMALIYRVIDIRPNDDSPLDFKDVSLDSWYYEYVKAAFDNKIINGTSATTFSPDGDITREMMITIIMRILNNKGLTFTLEKLDKDILMYEDAADISNWAVQSMFYGVKYGILGGRTEATLNPREYATRGEAAESIRKLYDLIKK